MHHVPFCILLQLYLKWTSPNIALFMTCHQKCISMVIFFLFLPASESETSAQVQGTSNRLTRIWWYSSEKPRGKRYCDHLWEVLYANNPLFVHHSQLPHIYLFSKEFPKVSFCLSASHELSQIQMWVTLHGHSLKSNLFSSIALSPKTCQLKSVFTCIQQRYMGEQSIMLADKLIQKRGKSQMWVHYNAKIQPMLSIPRLELSLRLRVGCLTPT